MTTADAMATLVELPPISIHENDGSESSIRLFQFTLNAVTVEVSSLGASITKVLLPRSSSPLHSTLDRDDVVLSYASQNVQYIDENKPFFGAIVGRVANRIKDGQFQLLQKTSSSSKLVTYQLEKNNGPNHLHGGSAGIWRNIWNANIVNNTVQFTLISQDGDQGYPGGVEITATYSLVQIDNLDDGTSCGAKLCLEMRAKLLPGETKATPISLTQHSYFNLASHSARSRILDHTLLLPRCSKFTPLDDTSIPTRQIQRVDSAGMTSMDFRQGKMIGGALLQYAEERCEEVPVDAIHTLQRVLASDESNMSDIQGPFGFDHNYIIDQTPAEQNSLRLAAILSHPPTGRSLQVFTNAPGMQLYTSNYLDGSNPPPSLCKEGVHYFMWQGICLETQTYPHSIYASDDEVIGDDEFSKGRCFILRPGGGEYFHAVHYEFRTLCSKRMVSEGGVASPRDV